LFYGRVERLQVVHNRGHGFSKRFTLQGCTNVPIHARSIQPRQGMDITTRPLLVLQESLGGATQLSYPQRSRPSSEGGPRSLRRWLSLLESSSERLFQLRVNVPLANKPVNHRRQRNHTHRRGGLETPPPSKVTPPKSKYK
jgi:hypothetical protein